MDQHYHFHLHLDGLLGGIEAKLDILLERTANMAVDLSGLQNAIAQLATDTSNETTEVGAKVDALEARITELQTTIDELVAGQVTQAQIDELTSQAAAVSAGIQAISDAADPDTETPPDDGTGGGTGDGTGTGGNV